MKFLNKMNCSFPKHFCLYSISYLLHVKMKLKAKSLDVDDEPIK